MVSASLLWTLLPQIMTWQPLLLLFLLWVRLAVKGKLPISRSRLDVWIWVFFVTAVLGVGTAYNKEQAWAKLCIVIGAILIYFALAQMPPSRIGDVMLCGTIVSFSVALYFFLTNDWRNWIADFSWLTLLGKRMLVLQSSLGWPAMHPNKAAGLIAMFLPLGAPVLKRYWQQNRMKAAIVFLSLVFTLFVLLLTSSRGAWVALVSSVFFLLLLKVISNRKRTQRTLTFKNIGLWQMGILMGIVILLAISFLSFNSISSSIPRTQLYRESLQLIADFPFTGSGLATFEGLYSRYIRIIPYIFFNYSHNLFLDVWLEQGPVALITIFFLLSISTYHIFGVLLQKDDSDHYSLLAGLIIVILHGLIDDPLYGFWGTPFLFFFPGLAAGFINDHNTSGWFTRFLKGNYKRILLIMAILLLFLAPHIKDIKARWFANLAALAMAQGELVNWPHNSWDYGVSSTKLEQGLQWSMKALALNPSEPTARYRLGLHAFYDWNFTQAVAHLQIAYQVRPTHRGVQKSLGYSLTWLGRTAEALDMLCNIPEAASEMDSYRAWWLQNERPDLAAKAVLLSTMLQNQGKSDCKIPPS